LTTAEIDDCARPDGYVHRLTRAWTTSEAAAAALGERAPGILGQYFDDAGNGDHLLRPDTDSESSIERLNEDGSVKAFLTERHRDRTVLEAHEESFAPAWFATTSSGYLKGSDESRQRIDAMVELYQERSKPIWLEMGRRLLGVVKESSTMLPCAEDLGVVPPGLPAVLADLGILSLKIERWETDEDGRLKDPATFPYLSVSTPGVHDTSALRGWWEEEDWNRDSFSLDLEIDEIPSWLTPEVAKLILLRSLRSNSAIRVFQIQDLFAVTLDLRTLSPQGERVNVPGSVGSANWSYSIPILIEKLADHAVTVVLRDLIARSIGAPDVSTPSVETPGR
jgi:4-alpha-glucanotransferase